MKLTKLNGYTGIGAGFTLASGQHIVVVAQDVPTLAEAFVKLAPPEKEKFNPALAHKAVVITKDLTAQ